MLEFEDARGKILGDARVLESERVELATALGRVLAEDLVTAEAIPHADTSAMDGYGLCVADLPPSGDDLRLRVVGESRAGVPLKQLQPNTACRIFTGAHLPSRADAVVLQEDVEREGDTIHIGERPQTGQHVRHRGSDVAEGTVALARGTRLSAFALSTAAGLDRRELLVTRPPRVTIVCTGDELRPAGSSPTPGTIAESNGIALAALAKRAGVHAHLAPLTRDDAESTREQLELALNSAEVLLTVGGVSVGDHDVVRQALSAAGASIEFWKVKIKPGKPLVYARAPGCTVLGLPGNPVSAQVTFCLFALPLLRAMQGDKRPLPPLHKAELAAPLRQRKGRMGFHRITVDRGRAYPLDNQNSGSVLSLSRADALARMPAECESLEIGDEVDILWLDQF